jgi:hypothetical protein
LVVFGGNNKSTSFNSVHVLESEGDKWRWVNPTLMGKAPFPRTVRRFQILYFLLEKVLANTAFWDLKKMNFLTRVAFLLLAILHPVGTFCNLVRGR